MDGRGSGINIGVLSDTHGWLDPELKKWLGPCHEIWHAGDVGDADILDELQNWGPRIRAVFGNIDGTAVRARIKEFELFDIQGYKVLLTHIARPGSYAPQLQQIIKSFDPQMLVCGHSHILKVHRTGTPKVLYVNPGAAGTHGFHKIRTALRFVMQQGRPTGMEVIELAPRNPAYA